MQLVDLDLGSLELEWKASGLHLQLSSHAAFAPSAKDDIDTLRERLTCELLNASSVNRPWITRGSAFRLELSVMFEDELDRSGLEELIQTLTTRLKTAKVTNMQCQLE